MLNGLIINIPKKKDYTNLKNYMIDKYNNIYI